MSLSERQEIILDQIRAASRVEVDDLAARFAVTTQTIRRDLADICDRGLATRTHGGARKLVSAASFAYEDRRAQNTKVKAVIGQKAASLIADGSSVLLNIGTTTEQVAAALTAHQGLTVISNNINIVHILREARLAGMIIAGGTVRQSDGAIVGAEAVDFIANYKADVAVIGTSSMDADGAILDFDDREVAVARAILKNARTKILVADHSKFDRSAPHRICDVADLDVVITDQAPPDTFIKAAKAAHTQLIILDPEHV